LMDEPTGNLDGQTATGIQVLMQSLKAEITTSFIVVTHDPVFAAQMDTSYLLNNGVLSADTSTGEQ